MSRCHKCQSAIYGDDHECVGGQVKHDKAALGKCWSRVTGSVFTMRESHDAASAAILDAEEKVRALEAKLASVEQELKCAHAFHDLVVKERDLARYQVGKAESRLAALRPLVRAAVEWERGDDSVNSREFAARVRALDPDLIAWAKGGE